MKTFRLLIILSLILSCLLLLSSCDDADSLSKPEKLNIEQTSLTLSWKKVNDARMYIIFIEPEGGEGWEASASKNSYSLANLGKGSYTLKVKALSKEDESLDSDWSEPLVFVREAEPGFVMTLINGGTEYELTNKGTATGDIVIPDTYRGKPVTSIGENAFFNKNDVTSVKLGANVTSIGKLAFGNCSFLTAVELSDKLTSIGENAFASCRLLEGKITFPDSLKTISTGAFSYCARISEVVFGENLEVIGKKAFTDCTGITSLKLSDGLESIGEYAFAGCTALTEVDFGTSVTTLGDYSFTGNTSLSSITVPDSVSKIGIGAFEGCSALSEVDLGEGLVSVDRSSFDGTAILENTLTNEFYVDKWFIALKDTSVNSVNIASDTVGIAEYAFYANRALSSLILPDSVKIIGSFAFADTLLSNIIIGCGAKTIGEKAFMASVNLSNVILGSYDFDTQKMTDSSLISIGNYAFRGCLSLYEIEIPNTVKSIGTFAFNNTGLEVYADSGVVYADDWAVGFTDELAGDVIIRSNTVGIANYAFYQCYNMSSVQLPGSVKIIGRAAFYECTYLYSMTLPDTLEVIDDYTFYGCKSLKIKTLPTMLKYIGKSAFYKCASTYALDDEDTENDTLIIPGNVEYIGDYAFYCSGQEPMSGIGEDYPARGIDIIIIGDNVKTIGKNAFYGFVTLKKVVIGNSVTEIGDKAFYKCPMLEEVVFGSSVTSIGQRAFYRCESLGNITLPDSLLSIGDYAFYKCEAITSLDLGDGVKEIGGSAFYGCIGIESLSLPTSLETIGKQAFRGCKSLSSVIISAEVDKIMDHAFYGCDNLTIYTDIEKAKDTWSSRWNSSYRPTVWGCTLSEDGEYVVSLAKKDSSVINRNSSNKISDPSRSGYTFGGWGSNSTTNTPSYTSESLTDAPNGRTLFAIWNEIVQ